MQKLVIYCHPLLLSALFFDTECLPESKVLFSYSGWLTKHWVFLSVSIVLRLKTSTETYMCAGDQNSTPHASTASTLPTVKVYDFTMGCLQPMYK